MKRCRDCGCDLCHDLWFENDGLCPDCIEDREIGKTIDYDYIAKEKDMKCKCHCGYEWESKIDNPKCCPKCKSYRWLVKKLDKEE